MPPRNHRAQARENGEKAENWIFKKIPNLKRINELIDSKFKDLDVELKSCQETIKDSSHKSGTRTGRFILEEEQHKFLCDHNGAYCFLVLSGSPRKTIIKKCFLIEAKELDLSIKGSKSIPWTILYNSRRK